VYVNITMTTRGVPQRHAEVAIRTGVFLAAHVWAAQTDCLKLVSCAGKEQYEVVGSVTAGGYAHSLGRGSALALVRAEVVGQRLFVRCGGILGEYKPAKGTLYLEHG
jgi:glycine cleavage system aminomethyltransferase T